MALTGIRQMSTVDTPPEDRQPVLTYVGGYDEGARARRRPPGAPPRGAGLLGPQPRRDDRSAGRVVAARAAGGADRHRPRADGRGGAREADDALLGSRRGRPRVHDDHRVRARRAEREHAGRRPGRHARAGAAVSAPRARRQEQRARLRLLLLPAGPRDDRGGARAARDDLRAPGARVGIPDRAAGPRDPRRREPARRGAARTHRGGGLRRLLPHPPAVGRRAPRRTDRRGEGAADRSAGPRVRAAGMGGAGVAPAGALPADLPGRRSRRARRASSRRRSIATARSLPRSRRCSRSPRSA